MFKRNKRGFTLIELIVVMAIIAILVLLAAPRFLSYTQEAKVTQIKADTKVMENVSEAYLAKHSELPEGWVSISDSTVQGFVDNEAVFNNKGLVEEGNEFIGTGFFVVDEEFVKTETKSKLNGFFVVDFDGNTYFIKGIAPGGAV